MRLHVAGAASFVLTIVLAGCAMSSPPATTSGTTAPGTGIEGIAMMGPTCPVEQNPPDPNCADRPYHGPLRVTHGDDPTVTVASFSTSQDGRFKVDLAPGVYRIQTPEGQSMPSCQTQGSVTVVSGSFSHVDVECDTGIR